jgi:hypothetical protein
MQSKSKIFSFFAFLYEIRVSCFGFRVSYFIGLYPMLIDYALSGFLVINFKSPERAQYVSIGLNPMEKVHVK